ncbi:MAG: hypothetical protein WA687_12530, partial [Solirubrobacterales bacterium]
LGREAVRFAGALADPRPAYAAADLMLGMGGSSLRALATGKPTIVQGERGFSKPFEPASRAYFLHHGFWGVGDGGSNTHRLAGQMRDLLSDPARREELGRYGRETVSERFSLERATRIQLDIYDEVLTQRAERRWGEAASAGARALRLEFDNHDPRRKRALAAAESARLAAAGKSFAVAA